MCVFHNGQTVNSYYIMNAKYNCIYWASITGYAYIICSTIYSILQYIMIVYSSL